MRACYDAVMRTRTIAILAVLLAACSMSAQQKALHATYIGVKAAEAGFDAWDHDHQADIVAKAPDLATGEARLNAYHATRGPVLQAFMLVYQLLYVAASDTTQERIDAAIAAATTLYQLIETIKKPAPPSATTERQRARHGIERVAQARRISPVVLRYLEARP
jgi:S-adenosylmethionine synthetase